MSTKRALVTGSAGFVGRHMVTELVERGWNVLGIDSKQGRPLRDSGVGNRPGVVDGEGNCVCFFHAPSAVFDLVVHCAAIDPHRMAIDTKPGHVIYNQLLDAAMFDWAIRTQQRRVLYLSSSAAYPVGFQIATIGRHLKEDDIVLDGGSPQPDASYGWTKLTGERLAAGARDCGVPVTVVRPFSGYGGDQSAAFPFGAMLARAVRRADPFAIWGDGSQVRDWIHIDDVVKGALAVVESGTTDPVNLCTGDGTSMAALARAITGMAGYRPTIEADAGMPAGVQYRVGDPTRMRQYYTPTVTLADGILRAMNPEVGSV